MIDSRFVPNDLDRLAARAAGGDRAAEADVFGRIDEFLWTISWEVVKLNRVRLECHLEEIHQEAGLAAVNLLRSYRLDKGASFLTYVRHFGKPLVIRWTRQFMSDAGCKISEKVRSGDRTDPVYRDAVSLSAPISSDGEDETCMGDVLPSRPEIEPDEETRAKGHAERLEALDEEDRLALSIRYSGNTKPRGFPVIAEQLGVSVTEAKRRIARAFRALGLADPG